MSRIGKKPIPLPEKVKVESRENVVDVTGPLGKFSQKLPVGITVAQDKNVLTVQTSESDHAAGGPLHGLARTLIYNAIIGVTQGFKKDLEIVGLGYRAQVTGDVLVLTLGFAEPVKFKIPAGIKISVDPKQTQVAISGIDAYLVGEVAARIRRLKKPEPYKQTGIRYAGEHIIKKAGKAAAGAVGAGAGGGKK